LEPRAVVEEPVQRNLEHPFQLSIVVDEGRHRVGKVRHEGHDREVRNRSVNRVAGAEGHHPADRHADLLSHLPLGGGPRRLALLDTTARQRDLARVVAQICPPAHKRDHPAAVRPVQNEYDGGPAGTPPKVPPAVDGMEQVFEAGEEISQIDPLVNSSRAGKLGKVAEPR